MGGRCMMSQGAESITTVPGEVCNRKEPAAMPHPLETEASCQNADIACYSALRHNRESLSSGSSNSGDTSTGRDNCCDLEDNVFVATPEYNTPIIGYEVMEERARFTVFKIRVEHVDSGRYWFVFRRYTDFTRLSRKLRLLFPGLRLSLPPKRWFGNNFDPLFLEDRLLGLQAFIKNIMSHRDISRSTQVREFFCLDEPPEPLDTIEESRALCESLEEKVYRLTQQLQEKDAEIESLQSELSNLRVQQSVLAKGIKVNCLCDESLPEDQAVPPMKHDSER